MLLLGSRGTVPPKDRLGRHGASAGAPPGDAMWLGRGLGRGRALGQWARRRASSRTWDPSGHLVERERAILSRETRGHLINKRPTVSGLESPPAMHTTGFAVIFKTETARLKLVAQNY